MFEKDRKRSTEITVSSNMVETIIGQGVLFEGTVTASTTLRIDGTLKGEIQSSGAVIIGEGGQVVGNITAQQLLIAGSVTGKVEVGDKTEFTETGYLQGDLVTDVLVITDGAVFDGSCKMRKEPLHEKKLLQDTLEDQPA